MISHDDVILFTSQFDWLLRQLHTGRRECFKWHSCVCARLADFSECSMHFHGRRSASKQLISLHPQGVRKATQHRRKVDGGSSPTLEILSQWTYWRAHQILGFSQQISTICSAQYHAGLLFWESSWLEGGPQFFLSSLYVLMWIRGDLGK